MNVAIIDLGTNTFNILIVKLEKGRPFETLMRTKSAVMLGSEGLLTGYLSDKAFSRSFSVLRDYSSMIKNFKCVNTIALGTSALRNAQNADHFIAKVKKELGINIVSISEEEETKYIYEGIRRAVPLGNDYELLVDIGGGSNEVMLANNNEILWSESYKLGSARLLETFKPSDPIQSTEIKRLYAHFDSLMARFNEVIKQHPVSRIIGSSGAFDSFADMIFQEMNNVPIPLNSLYYDFSSDQFNRLFYNITHSTREERFLFRGIEGLRLDTIVMSSTFTNYLIMRTGVTNLTQSAYAMSEGIAIELESTLM